MPNINKQYIQNINHLEYARDRPKKSAKKSILV